MNEKTAGRVGVYGFLAFLLVLFIPLSFALAQSAPSLSITSLTPGGTVNAGTQVSFAVVATGFTNPTYSISDSYSGTSVSSSDLNSSGVFTWTPAQGDIGTHNLTITAIDSSGDNASITQQIIVNNTPSLSVSSLSPGTSVSVGQDITFDASASYFTGTPAYSVSDSFSDSSMTTGAINSSSGTFSWTPESQDVGTHTITISATDSNGDSVNTTETITVNQSASLFITSLSPGSSVAYGNPVAFTVTATGFNSPTFTIGDSDSETSVNNGDINSSGYFSWTPSSSDVGTHTLSIFATDSSGHSANVSQTITVTSAALTIESISPGYVDTVGEPLTFTVSAPGFSSSTTYSVSDSFGGSTPTQTSITSADINAAGYFSWTPLATDAGVHDITITGADTSGHSGNASINIIVDPATTTTSVTPTTTTISALTTTTSTTEFTEYLSLGSTGSQVTALQQILYTDGYLSVQPTGYFGTLTAAAINEFQAAHGISQVGVVGPLTRAALNALGSSSTSSASNTSTTTTSTTEFTEYLSLGSTGSQVTALQQILYTDGYLSVQPTGYFGTLTAAAINEFQAAHGISQVGVVGPLTRAALNAL